tara:strand:+ start:2598 stop:2879 length:282 start_codon:yes stop_codon:yes gene_type:complete
MKNVFNSATENFQFTLKNMEDNGLGGKKVFEFHPSQEKWMDNAVFELGMFGKGMNVKSITESGLMLYTFDMLGNRITAKIKFKDVELGNTLDV